MTPMPPIAPLNSTSEALMVRLLVSPSCELIVAAAAKVTFALEVVIVVVSVKVTAPE